MIRIKKVLLFFCILAACVAFSSSNIHRAIQSRVSRKNREDGFLAKYFAKTKSAWLFSIPAALLVGLTGILPLLIIPVETGRALKEGVSPKNLKVLLSFAVGGLLGDVFLHLLPEAWMYRGKDHDHFGHISIGLWVIVGLLTFLFLEKVFGEEENDTAESEELSSGSVDKHYNNDSVKCNGSIAHTENEKLLSEDNKYASTNGKLVEARNGFREKSIKNSKTGMNGLNGINGFSAHCSNGDINGLKKRHNDQIHNDCNDLQERSTKELKQPEQNIKVVGYLNLMANCIDNFTHGLAVAGSFIAGPKVGLCTTIAILLHEIPHEIGDFAILLKSGFNRWDAAKGQMITAMGGVLGAVFGLVAEEAGDSTAWVLPFTSGGFIYIALVTVVPDLLKEKDFRESVKQTLSMLAGIGTMALVTAFHH